jgi:hypothetical protein
MVWATRRREAPHPPSRKKKADIIERWSRMSVTS